MVNLGLGQDIDYPLGIAGSYRFVSRQLRKIARVLPWLMLGLPIHAGDSIVVIWLFDCL